MPTLPRCVNSPLEVIVADSAGWTRNDNCNDCGSKAKSAQQLLEWFDGAVRKRRGPGKSEATLLVISGTRTRETVSSVSRLMASIQPPRRLAKRTGSAATAFAAEISADTATTRRICISPPHSPIMTFPAQSSRPPDICRSEEHTSELQSLRHLV